MKVLMIATMAFVIGVTAYAQMNPIHHYDGFRRLTSNSSDDRSDDRPVFTTTGSWIFSGVLVFFTCLLVSPCLHYELKSQKHMTKNRWIGLWGGVILAIISLGSISIGILESSAPYQGLGWCAWMVSLLVVMMACSEPDANMP